MPVIVSKLDPASAAFTANTQRMAERLAEVQRLEGLVIAESESKRERFEQRGQLLPRERIARLLDRGSGFLELSRLAGLNMHDDDGKKAVAGVVANNAEHGVTWVHSYVNPDRTGTFCVYDGPSPEAIEAMGSKIAAKDMIFRKRIPKTEV